MKPQRSIDWKGIAGTALMVTVLSLDWVPTASAQSQTEPSPDVRQLHKKIELMEKQMQEQRDQMGV